MEYITGDFSSLDFAQKSREAAEKYEWIYHCTREEDALKIIRTRKMWLSNLRDVNDKEEKEKIDLKEYRDKFFVACFTYDYNIPTTHWNEYATQTDGVLIGFKQDWFDYKPTFLLEDKTEDHKNKIYGIRTLRPVDEYTTVWSLQSKGFYKVVYDDTLVKKLLSDSGTDCTIKIPDVAGIIKKTHGKCIRPGQKPYDKNWEEEKEIRLKLYIDRICKNEELNKCDYSKISVTLNKKAFQEIVLKFSPEFPQKEKQKFLSEISGLLPKSSLKILP